MNEETARQIRDWIEFNRIPLHHNTGVSEEKTNTALQGKTKSEFEDFVRERVPSQDGATYYDPTYLWGMDSLPNQIKHVQRTYLVRYFKKNNRKLYFLSFFHYALNVFLFVLPPVGAVYVGYLLRNVVNHPLLLTVCGLMGYLVCFQLVKLLSTKPYLISERKLFNSKELERENEEFTERLSLMEMSLYDMDYGVSWAKSRYDLPLRFVDFGPNGRNVEIAGNAPRKYHWKWVRRDGWIIADRKTKKEAPLLSGVEPYKHSD